MIVNSRLPLSIIFAVLILSIAQCASAPDIATHCAKIQIISNELRKREAEKYCRYAAKERDKVESFWGTTWDGPIRISVDSSYKITKALIHSYHGENRGFMEMPLRRVRENNGGLVHEIVHIYAPNGNRFLAEGLSVYLQEKIGGNKTFFIYRANRLNDGQDFADLVREHLPKIDSLELLNSVRTPRPLGGVANSRAAYIIAGSFVGFLIETYGLKSFKTLYKTEDYSKVYNKSLAFLEIEWRKSIAGVK